MLLVATVLTGGALSEGNHEVAVIRLLFLVPLSGPICAEARCIHEGSGSV